MDAGSSSYRFEPKSPENWSVKTVNRNGRPVRQIRLRAWQLEAHMILRDAGNGILRAFCGAGKTMLARSIGAYKIVSSKKRQVFCVPKNDIGNDGFASSFDIEIPWGLGGNRNLNVEAPINFCSPEASSKIEELVRLLCQPPVEDDCAKKDIVSSSMQIVITHQLLTLAIKIISKDSEKLANFIKNNTFWVDECHHIKGHDDSQEEKVAMNLLGKFTNQILDSNGKGVELFAMTATPYRGDYSKLFSPKQMKKFASYSLDFLEYFPTLGIEQVDIEMEEYSNIEDVANRVARNIGKEFGKRHLVFVPPTKRKWRRKKGDVDRLFKAIYEVIMRKTGCDLETAKSQVLDLVTESTQAANQKLLRQEPKSGDSHPSRFRVVVACMLCREGSDWCPADRIHNTSMEDSAPLNFQTNGRLFRQYPDKKHVVIRYYVKKFKTILKGKREFISDRVNYILHYMLMDDLFRPIMVNVPPFSPVTKEAKSTNKGRSTLEQVFGPQYQDMKLFLLTSMADADFTEEAVDHAISRAMEKYLPRKTLKKEHKTQIRMALKAFLLRCRSKDLRSSGVDVSFIRENGFDSVVESNGIGGNMFTSNLSLEELKRFRETVKNVTYTEEQTIRIAEGIKSMVSKMMPDAVEYSQEHLRAIKAAIKEYEKIQEAYRKSSETKEYSPEGVAKIAKMPVAHVKKMIGLYNRFCMPKEIKFNFRKDSQLAKKIVSFGQVA